MKNIRLLTFVLIIGTLVLSACGAGAATPAPEATRSAKVEAMPVAFVGIVDSIAGDQWVISGTTVTVNETVVRDGPFNVGDQVKVEAFVHPDGSFTISRVESPTPQESATLPAVSVDNSNEAISNANTNDANINNSNINDDGSGGVNSNDDNSNASISNDDNSNASNDNSDDNGANDNGDDNGGKGRGGDDDQGGDDNGGGGHGSDDD